MSSAIDVAYFMFSSDNFKSGFKRKLKMRGQGRFKLAEDSILLEATPEEIAD